MKYIKRLIHILFKIGGLLKWELKKKFQSAFHFLYINIPPLFLKRINLENDISRIGIDIYVVAFNNFDTIQFQYEKLTNHLEEDFNYIIIDNSSKIDVRRKLYNYCYKRGLPYVSLPYQKVLTVSASHALALNWMSKNILKRRKPMIFGLIDHDIFPIKSYSIINFLRDKPFYGVRHFALSSQNKTMWDVNSQEFWYLWPGFLFFHYKSIKDLRLNFMPMVYKGNFFDTGGELFKTYYSKLNQIDSSWFVHHQWAQITPERGVDIFDHSWVHIANASDWRGINEKLDYIKLSQIVKSVKVIFGV